MFIKALIFNIFILLFACGQARAGEIASSNRSVKAVKDTRPNLELALQKQGLEYGNPIFMRIVKSRTPAEGRLSGGVLELYVQKYTEGENGEYVLFKTYDICAASGVQGPKMKQGDGQSPEGFYYINAGRFNPWSSYHLSLNLGYPNTYDRAHKRTGNFLMVHGKCVSIGCYAMTDAGINEIYTLAQAAVKNGQKIVRVHSFPFPMSTENMDAVKGNSHANFWTNLKQGWDWFEMHKIPPNVNVQRGEYVFSPLPVQN